MFAPPLIHRVFEEKAQERPDYPFLTFEGATWTFGRLNDRASRIGRAVAEQVKRGDRVAFLLPNVPEFILAQVGVARAGAVSVPLHTGLRGEGLAHLLEDSGARGIFVHPDALEGYLGVRERLKDRIIFEVLAEEEAAPAGGPPAKAPEGFLRMREFYQAPPGDLAEGIDPQETFQILYTSGTTGLPKGVLFPHALLQSGAALRTLFGYTPDDVLYTCLPLFHLNAQGSVFFAALDADARMVLGRKFSASRFWAEVARAGATAFNSLGTLLAILHKQPPGPGDRAHRVRRVSSSGCPRSIWTSFEERFGVRIMEFYGSVEGGIIFNDGSAPPGSIGKPIAIYEAKVVGEGDRECAPNEVGELILRSTIDFVKLPTYHNQPRATAEKTRGGWLRTGDLAYRDPEGWFWFVDRAKECVRRRGENISTFEVEQAIDRHPAVLESAVYALPSEVGEDEVAAAVVLQPEAKLSAGDLWDFLDREGRLARFQLPRFVRFVGELEKTGTTKIQKVRLKREGITPETWDREKEKGRPDGPGGPKRGA